MSTRAPALAYPQGGRTKTLTLTEDEASEVAAALARYAAAKPSSTPGRPPTDPSQSRNGTDGTRSGGPPVPFELC